MNSQDIYDGVTDIRDDLIDGAKAAPKKRKHWGKKRWLGAVAAVLAVAIVGGIFLRPTAGFAIAQAQYPEVIPYPNESDFWKPDGSLNNSFYDAYDAWWKDMRARQQLDLGDTSPLQTFFARSSQTFLADADGENRVYSPLNVYMALSMLAQLTGGESR